MTNLGKGGTMSAELRFFFLALNLFGRTVIELCKWRLSRLL